MWIKQYSRQACTNGRANPPGTIDRKVRMTTHSRRNELINSGVNRRILSTNSCASQHTASGEPDKVEGEGCRDSSNQINAQCNHKKHFAPKLIGHTTKKKCAHYSTNKIRSTCCRDLHISEVQRLWVLEDRADHTDNSYLKSIQNPRNTKCNNNEPVPPAPGKTIHPGGNIGSHRLHLGSYLYVFSFHGSQTPLPLSTQQSIDTCSTPYIVGNTYPIGQKKTPKCDVARIKFTCRIGRASCRER